MFGAICTVDAWPGMSVMLYSVLDDFLVVEKSVLWFWTTRPAMDAEESVAKMPVNKADMATRDTSPLRPGEISDRTPIWVPRDPKLPKPHTA